MPIQQFSSASKRFFTTMKKFFSLSRVAKRQFSTATKYVNLYINGQKASVPAGTSIYDACKAVLPQNMRIPTLCHHPYLKPTGVCRVCLVQKGPDVKNTEADYTLQIPQSGFGMVPSCATPVYEGMNVWTNTEDVR